LTGETLKLSIGDDFLFNQIRGKNTEKIGNYDIRNLENRLQFSIERFLGKKGKIKILFWYLICIIMQLKSRWFYYNVLRESNFARSGSICTFVTLLKKEVEMVSRQLLLGNKIWLNRYISIIANKEQIS